LADSASTLDTSAAKRFLRPGRTSRWYTASLLLQNRLSLTGGLIILLVVLAAVLAPVLTPANPMLVNPADRLIPPGGVHPFGTDDFGRDIFARVIYGARLSLEVGGLVLLFSTVVGGLIGLAAGFYSRWDNWLMRVMDGMMAFPGVLLATAIMASLGPRVSNVIIALSVVYAPRLARVVRGQVLVVRMQTYVEAAIAQGSSDSRVLFRHVLPNCLSPVIVQSSVTFAYAVLTEASLSFLGVGAPPDIPSWGNILSDGRNFMIQAPWMTLFPGIAIMITVLGLNLFGDGLRDVLSPRDRD
jgi:peptide/nickel transport system permease protein